MAIHERIDKDEANHLISGLQEIRDFYNLLFQLRRINGENFEESLIERMMFNSETLPPLGKEYWWYLGFDFTGEKPRQLMILIFRKYGEKMFFNDKEMTLKTYRKNRFKAVISGWVYDGEQVVSLGDTNAIVELQPNRIVTHLSGQDLVISGEYPHYTISLGDLIDLNIERSASPQKKLAQGVLVPPFGVGWVDTFGSVEGTVYGQEFRGESHLQKVVGVNPFGPFHWSRLIFQDKSVATLFTLKTGKSSETLFHRSLKFYDNQNHENIFFVNPKMRISKKIDDGVTWVVEASDHDKECTMELESHAEVNQVMKGGGSQVYVEYAVVPRKFSLQTRTRDITLDDLGKGWGTFEDAYW